MGTRSNAEPFGDIEDSIYKEARPKKLGEDLQVHGMVGGVAHERRRQEVRGAEQRELHVFLSPSPL